MSGASAWCIATGLCLASNTLPDRFQTLHICHFHPPHTHAHPPTPPARTPTHPPQYEYFDAPGSLAHMTLHAAADPARGRALYALHIPADRRCQVWVVNPAARGGQRVIASRQRLVAKRAEGVAHHRLNWRAGGNG